MKIIIIICWVGVKFSVEMQCITNVNFRRPEWGVFVPLEMVVSRRLEIHAVYQLPSEPCTPDASSIGVEWSGNVTAAGSTSRGMV